MCVIVPYLIWNCCLQQWQVEIAMVEVYMDEVYDLLEPRKKERQKLNVFNNKGEAGPAPSGSSG